MEIEKKKEVLKAIHCFKGPVFEALVYTYYQTYTQDTDMYTYSLNTEKISLFSKNELEMLKQERRPSNQKFLLLLKVLQNCCTPSLADFSDPVWSSNILKECTTNNRVEHILVFLANSYKEFMHRSDIMSLEDIAFLIENLCLCVKLLIKKSAELSKSKRWEDENDKLQEMFSKITKGDFKSVWGNISDIVRVEAEFRSEMLEVLLCKELKDFNGHLWHLEEFVYPDQKSSNSNNWKPAESIELNLVFQTLFEKKKKVCWIVGDHGIGKSSLAAYISFAWAQKNVQFELLQTFSAVFIISLSEFKNFNVNEETIFQVFFPLTNLFLSQDTLESWLKNEKCLIIMDDVTHHSEKIVKFVYSKLKVYCNLYVLFMGRLSSGLKYTRDSCLKPVSVFLELKGFKEEEIINISQDLKSDVSEICLHNKLKENMNRFGAVLKYPTICDWTFQVWEENPKIFNNIYSASELIWEILAWRVKKIIKINIKKSGSIRKKFLNWLMLAGELALYCLKADLRLDTRSLEELEIKIVSIYKEKGKNLLNTFFKVAIQFSCVTCFTTISSTSKPFLEYLSSWFFVDQLLKNIHVSQLTNGLVNKLPLILFGAGHLERFKDEGSITIHEERRLIKALVNYQKGSFEDFSFIQMFVAEIKCIKRLVEIVIDETEYNEEWNLDVSEMQLKSLEVLLSHVSPTRLILLADSTKKNYEMLSVINFICRVDISVWFDSASQFTYGSTHTLDKLVKPFLGKIIAPKVDLISGSLSSSMIEELGAASSTQNLVMLKLKVSCNQCLNKALLAPKSLHKLLWLEVKIDMNFNEIDLTTIQPTDVALFGVHLRCINDSDVQSVIDLLLAMHSRFTGINLEETTLTPEGVFTLLKELSKRGVSLRAETDYVMKFQMWYYPSLSSLPKWKKVTEEECLELIGHDDREFFSDHHIASSQFVTVLDAWNLGDFLETQKDIVYFIFEASNIIFTKRLDGFVEITFKGDYKEVIHDKVIAGNSKESDGQNAEGEIIDLY